MKVTWRLDKHEIESEVEPPEGVSLDKLCSALKPVVHDYLDGTSMLRLRQWQRIQKLTESKTIIELRKVIRDMATVDPDPRHHLLLDALKHFSARAKFEATMFYGPRGQRRLLYAGVMRAWTNAGGILGASESGPLQRLLCLVAKRLKFTLSPRGAKDAIEREKNRRERLETLNIRWSGPAK